MASVTLSGAHLRLHPFRAVYWQEMRTLLLADLHLGKAAHFRKEGIAVPRSVEDSDLDRFTALLLEWEPERVVLLGDLFHSEYNAVWEEVGGLFRQFHHIRFELVAGNHDILPEAAYRDVPLEMHPDTLVLEPFIFSHHPLEDVPEGLYNMAGHLHPAVRLNGVGKQRERLPCFFFGEKQGILPAFGSFTGTAIMRPGKADRVFVVTGNEVLEV